MKLATWNVNSLNVRLPHVLQWCGESKPDIVGLQELKMTDDRFPESELREAGYHSIFSGQKTYNGVAIISRTSAGDVVKDIDGLDDPSRRIIAGTIDGVRVINLYVVNGKSVDSEFYAVKLEWLTKVREFVREELTRHERLVVIGDFNIAPDDRDVHDPDQWRDKILCSKPEREMFQSWLDLGLHDSFRQFEQDEKTFSWWDYRAAGFRRGLGLRIDLLLNNAAMAERCTASYIDKEPRKWERPSDHTPAVAEYDLT